jgi:hypothetical protein
MLSFDKREGFVRLAPLNLRESQMHAHGVLGGTDLEELAIRPVARAWFPDDAEIAAGLSCGESGGLRRQLSQRPAAGAGADKENSAPANPSCSERTLPIAPRPLVPDTPPGAEVDSAKR